jgi:hypothetical protein
MFVLFFVSSLNLFHEMIAWSKKDLSEAAERFEKWGGSQLKKRLCDVITCEDHLIAQ